MGAGQSQGSRLLRLRCVSGCKWTRDWCVVYAGFKLGSTKAVNEAAKWKKVSHPNIVSLRELFTTKSFGDNCEGEGAVSGRVLCEEGVCEGEDAVRGEGAVSGRVLCEEGV